MWHRKSFIIWSFFSFNNITVVKTLWGKNFLLCLLLFVKIKMYLPKNSCWQRRERFFKRHRAIQVHTQAKDKKYIILHFNVCCKQNPDRSDRSRTRKTNRKQRGESTTEQSTTKQLMPSGLWFFIAAVAHIDLPPSPASLSLSLSLQDINNILMWFYPEMNRKWNMSPWDLIDLQMTVRADRNRPRLCSWVDRWSSPTVHTAPSDICRAFVRKCIVRVLCFYWLSHTSSCCKMLNEQKPVRH